jgi:hypothetical protein
VPIAQSSCSKPETAGEGAGSGGQKQALVGRGSGSLRLVPAALSLPASIAAVARAPTATLRRARTTVPAAAPLQRDAFAPHNMS